jgi:hypothetical protein
VSQYPAVPELDRVIELDAPTLDDYLAGASAYVMQGRELPARRIRESESAKAAQTALSKVLANVIAAELSRRHRDLILRELGPEAFRPAPRKKLPHVLTPDAGETRVAGGLRTAQSDVTEAHRLDGVRLAIELKPTYRAVGRAIWNRYGDVRAFAVNIHLKFPFAVVGGVQVLPTIDLEDNGLELDTTGYLDRAARRLSRIRARQTEADAHHLLEAFGLIVFDPRTQQLDANIPPKEGQLRWDQFLDALTVSYDTRFGAEAE